MNLTPFQKKVLLDALNIYLPIAAGVMEEDEFEALTSIREQLIKDLNNDTN